MVSKGPGGDSSGGAAFRPGWRATLPNQPKPQGWITPSRAGVRIRLVGHQGDWRCRRDTTADNTDR